MKWDINKVGGLIIKLLTAFHSLFEQDTEPQTSPDVQASVIHDSATNISVCGVTLPIIVWLWDMTEWWMNTMENRMNAVHGDPRYKTLCCILAFIWQDSVDMGRWDEETWVSGYPAKGHLKAAKVVLRLALCVRPYCSSDNRAVSLNLLTHFYKSFDLIMEFVLFMILWQSWQNCKFATVGHWKQKHSTVSLIKHMVEVCILGKGWTFL